MPQPSTTLPKLASSRQFCLGEGIENSGAMLRGVMSQGDRFNDLQSICPD
ncbi:MAG: hypothetical protein WCA35_23415 [Kovacikia sp.]